MCSGLHWSTCKARLPAGQAPTGAWANGALLATRWGKKMPLSYASREMICKASNIMIVVQTRGGGQKFFVIGNYFGPLNTDSGTGPSWMNSMEGGEEINCKTSPKEFP